jgi:hypothetical protein
MLVVGTVAALAGAVCGLALVRATNAGDDWDDWQRAELLGDPIWTALINGAVILGLFAGLIGFFLPDWLRVALVAQAFGFCVPFFVEGIRRIRRRPKRAAPPAGRYQFPSLLELLGAAVLCAATTFVLGLRGVDIAVAAGLGAFVWTIRSLIDQFFDRRNWF